MGRIHPTSPHYIGGEKLLRLFKRPKKELGGGKPRIRFPIVGEALPPYCKILERYPLNPPFTYAVIAEEPTSSSKLYFLDEVPLNHLEASIYTYLLDVLENELTVPRDKINPREYFAEQAKKVLIKYKKSVSAVSWNKILYYAERDLVGFGIIDGLMKDPNIEDISLDGVGRPIFVFHRRYESLPTNIRLRNDEEVDNLITRLCHLSGKHISTAFPIIQGTLPGGHRLSATFRREISPYGGTFTIRKFREDPITIIDMLNQKVLNHTLAAYTWLLMENRATTIVVGTTGSGKTTLLNALLTLTRMNSKLVTIEEVREINIAHPNWVALTTRPVYYFSGDKSTEIGLFELVKLAMRMRPDILVVGEVRGEEAYVLFQAIATGHGGLCTLHADDTASAIQRLISKPMDVAPSFIPFLDLVFVVKRISQPHQHAGSRVIRRIVSVDEVINVGSYLKMFEWDPLSDTFNALPFKRSVKLARLARDLGLSLEEIEAEIHRRSLVLKWIQHKNIRNYRDLSLLLEEYVSSPKYILSKVAEELPKMGVKIEAEVVSA
jgi:flagellar protein FlaI